MRVSVSPRSWSSRVCMSTQTLHPLIWLARSSTSLCVVAGIPARLVDAVSLCSAGSAPATVMAGLSILGSMPGLTGTAVRM